MTNNKPETAISAVMTSKQQLFLACPHCNDGLQHSVTHFLLDGNDHNFGPWQCSICGWVVNGRWHHATKSVSITSLTERPKPIKGYLLLRIASSKREEPVWFVVENDIRHHDEFRSLAEQIEFKRRWVNEHTCPINIVPVEAIIEGYGPSYNYDPHGVIEFVAWAPRPDDLQDDDEEPDWRTIFPILGPGVLDITDVFDYGHD